MENQNVKEVLSKFITRVVNQSKRLLTLKSKNRTKKLHKSIKGKSKVNPNSIEVGFEMEDYGKFQDRGVKGVGGTKADGTPYQLKRVTRNGLNLTRPYRFSNKMIPASAFMKDRLGRPVSLGRAMATARTVRSQGIESSEFFTRPFESAFKDLPQELVEAYGLDIEDFLEFTLKE